MTDETSLSEEQVRLLRELVHAAITHGASTSERDHEATWGEVKRREADFLATFPVVTESDGAPPSAARSLAGAMNLPGTFL